MSDPTMDKPAFAIGKKGSVVWLTVLITLIALAVIFGTIYGVAIYLPSISCSLYPPFMIPYADCNPSNAGEFGDMFGIANALFSGLAFTAVAIAVYVQTRELDLQHNELILTREVFESQQFHNNFFQLIEQHENIVDSVRFDHFVSKSLKAGEQHAPTNGDSPTPVEPTGRLAFMRYYEEFRTEARKPDSAAQAIYLALYQEHSAWIDHYFRSMFNLLRMSLNLLRHSNVPKEEYNLYRGLIRSRISTSELLLLFYNGIYNEKASPSFVLLMQWFDLFRHLPNDQLVNPSDRDALSARENDAELELKKRASSPDAGRRSVFDQVLRDALGDY